MQGMVIVCEIENVYGLNLHPTKIICPLILSVDFSMCDTMHRKKLEGFVGMARKVCKLLHILHVHICI